MEVCQQKSFPNFPIFLGGYAHAEVAWRIASLSSRSMREILV